MLSFFIGPHVLFLYLKIRTLSLSQKVQSKKHSHHHLSYKTLKIIHLVNFFGINKILFMQNLLSFYVEPELQLRYFILKILKKRTNAHTLLGYIIFNPRKEKNNSTYYYVNKIITT